MIMTYPISPERAGSDRWSPITPTVQPTRVNPTLGSIDCEPLDAQLRSQNLHIARSIPDADRARIEQRIGEVRRARVLDLRSQLSVQRLAIDRSERGVNPRRLN